MIRHRQLLFLFSAILVDVAGGCSSLFGCRDPTSAESRIVDAAELEKALEDGELSFDECVDLCDAELSEWTTSATSASTTIGEESSTSATGTSTGTGTGTDLTTTDDVSSTSDGSTTSSSSEGDPSDTTAPTAGSDSATGGAVSPDFLGCELGDDPGTISCKYTVFCLGGRRPAGLRSDGLTAGTTSVGRWLAQLGHLEAASVPAFEQLAAELHALGAPPELITAAERAADDERRHAARIGALAVDHGAVASRPVIDPPASRSRLAIAIENAIEGCVAETYAALVCAFQSKHAGDIQLRRCMAEIAADEARHAALAWAIDDWLRSQLSVDERVAVDNARTRAALALREVAANDPTLVHQAGLPDEVAAEQLWECLDRALWRTA